MHYRLVAVITAALLFLTIPASLAQGYSIRADAKINLRSWYSTTASIVETVPAGTVLQVIGSFNRWLNIDRSGTEVWMADWVNFTRIQDGGTAAVSQPESQETAPQTRGAIDNCCFVDRQCNTDDEWISGYMAFQNNQCSAPSQTLSPPVSQPARQETASPSQGAIDNYCFTIWTCVTDDDWRRGYMAYQSSGGSETPRTDTPAQSPQDISLPDGAQTFYEILGAETLTTDSLLLTQGTWNVRIITAANAQIHANGEPGQHCFGPWYGDTVLAIFLKLHNILGGTNEEEGSITLVKDCNVSFHVWAPRHAWSLKLTKV